VDIQMPEMDGFELTRRIRESLPADRQPYIIAMSAGAAGATRERSLRAGMNDYLKKPLRSETLRAALAYSPLCDHMPEVPTRNGNDTAQVPGRLKKALAPDTPAAREPTRQPESA
jgi:CheY-like chemotaxis protein